MDTRIGIASNDVEARDLGGGVVIFDSAISFDFEEVVRICEEQISSERKDMYVPGVDPETGKQAFVNKSGYLYTKNGVSRMPRRGSMLHSTGGEEIRSFFSEVERIKDEYLLKYMTLFPLAYKNIWWKVKGHLVSYSAEKGGDFLGQHSDTSADYAYGYPHPSSQLATKNTLSCVVYLNEDFDGGHHYFNYLDIDIIPKIGSIIMFPSNFIAAHEITPVTRGTRYSYLGWYSHGSPNNELNEHIVDPNDDPDVASRATNVYMPELRINFRRHLEKIGFDRNSYAYQLVSTMHGQKIED